jgi:sec-independent protein translocase protein TatA
LLAHVSLFAHLLGVEGAPMGEFSIWHWLIVMAVVLLLFGGGRVSGLMGDLAKGIKAFKRGMADMSEGSHPAEARLEQAEDHQPETQHG